MEKDLISKDIAEGDLASSREIALNDSGTCAESGSKLTQARSGFDLEDARRALIARRVRAGARSPEGYTCSNLIDQLERMRTYVRPAWAKDERQTLPWMIRQQMKRLAPRVVEG